MKMRELLTLCIVSSLGGCENQVKAHVQGNLNVGNSTETMITAITHCLPYMGLYGFPENTKRVKLCQ
ncbi:carboxymuconolactone decarboxylase family protein [Alicyclobacillus fastidiosus]|uniref:Carboxymuconolactone decarboxylase family protein n=1 Tax=Alicyclobacillus fastidiosus TaxID=392011 RepID=A0ABY6ZEY4_9BACL|nr:carboxymuconolactone decarboxylase family protein [Alicyclobacillus fastidiosus]WAH41409.1 carboxymuconolactone decarboxylase family protein [Alicyclobacillus fastidiosus]